jgi:chemotaxis protein CheD
VRARDLCDAAQPPRDALYLHPGQLAVAAHPQTLSTILGSCVGVCLFDPERGVGGMNHFLLPSSQGQPAPSPRYGDVAMQQLLAQVLQAGGRPRFLAARVFGGACVLQAFSASNGHLGERNVATALDFLAEAGIPVVQCTTGGRRGRKLTFHTHSGAACAREI